MLPTLLGAARALAWSRWGAIVCLTTLDGIHWQVAAVDADDPAVRLDDAPTGCDTSAEGAVQMWLDAVHDAARADGDAGELVEPPRTLADLYPELPGVIVVPAPAAAGREVA